MTQLFGWISSIAFGICAIPQAMMSYKDGHSNGMSNGLLTLWMIGETTGLMYAVGLNELPLMLNYGANALFVGVVMHYKFFPRNKT